MFKEEVVTTTTNVTTTTTTMLPEINIDETYALTELRHGTWNVTPIVDHSLIDLKKVSVRMEPFWDPNTDITYTSMDNRTLIVGHDHVFYLGFVDIYGNNVSQLIDIDPPFFFHFRTNLDGFDSSQNSSGLNDRWGQHYLNDLDKRLEWKVNLS